MKGSDGKGLGNKELAYRALPWERLALGRAQLRASSDQDPNADVLRQYQAFLMRISLTFHAGRERVPLFFYGSMFLSFLYWVGLVGLDWGPCSDGFPPLLSEGQELLLYMVGLAYTIIFTLLAISMCLSGRAYVPGESHVWFQEDLSSTVADSLIHALRTRVAMDERDYNLGVRGVLQALQRNPLPTLDHDLPGPSAHTDLTLHLLRRTSSPYPLLVSPLYGIREQPSWAMNWSYSVHRHRSWEDFLIRAAGTRIPNAVPGSECGWKSILPTNGSILARGHDAGLVIAVYEMIPISDCYRESDEENHLHNLRLMLRLLKSADAEQNTFAPVLSASMPHLLYSQSYDVAEKHFEMYRRRVFEGISSRASTALLLRHLRRTRTITFGSQNMGTGQTSSYTEEEPATFPTHVRICNRIARLFSVVFSMTLADRPTETKWGIASRAVRPRDKVMLLAGVPVPMVMRPSSMPTEPNMETTAPSNGAPTAVAASFSDPMKLVSPAGIMGLMQGQAWKGGDGLNLPYVRIL